MIRQTVVQLVAPKSLSIDRSLLSNEEIDAHRVRSHCIQPGDLILVATPGLFYGTLRTVSYHNYDHVAVVLDKDWAFHASPPSIRRMPLARLLVADRHPLVLRPNLSPDELETFLKTLHGVIGSTYDVFRLWAGVIRVGLEEYFSLALPPFKSKISESSKWICSDVIVYALIKSSSKWDEFIHKSRYLDLYKHGLISLNDFEVICSSKPEMLKQIPLPSIKALGRKKIEGSIHRVVVFLNAMIQKFRDILMLLLLKGGFKNISRRSEKKSVLETLLKLILLAKVLIRIGARLIGRTRSKL